jgi:hypothetical protein
VTLLETIWGSNDGYRCVAERELWNNLYLDHNAFVTDKDCNYWFAPALFHTDSRKQENVKSIGALWLDIDYKDFDSQDAAIEAFESFIAKTGMPEPVVVESGHGAHVYWIFDQHVSRETWQDLAEKLRNACKKFELKADHVCTCDSARVLRVPGTFNYKDPSAPKQVTLVTDIKQCNVETLHDALAPYKVFVDAKKAKSFNAKFAVDLPSLPKDANKIADECAQMRAMRDTRGNIPEPQWYAGLGVLALCENGNEFAHCWSNGHEKYSHQETEDKFERAKEFAPSTCERFRSVNDQGCQGCPQLGRITSPIQLGEYVPKVEIKVEKQEPESEAQTEITLPVPKFYEIGPSGVYFTPPPKDKDDSPSRVLIIFQPLQVSRVMLNEANGESEVEVVWVTPRGKQRTASFKQELLARPTDMNAWLKSHNISIAPKASEQVVYYLQACINLINQQYDEETVYDRFGWHSRGFVVGSDLIVGDGTQSCRVSETVDRRRLLRLGQKGSVTEWANGTRLFDRADFWMHRFSVCALLASPLLRLSDSEGSVLSLSGESSGGKTTSAAYGLSAFGSPKAMTINPQSTENAFYEFWRLMSNLPVLCNEAVTMDEKKLSNVVYAAANGEARDRLQRDGKMKEAGNFATVTCLTNNKHILALSDRVLNEATRRRILELTFNKENVMPLNIGTELNRIMRQNYGVAGRAFLQHVMKNRDQIERRVSDRTALLEKGIHSANRYNVWLVAAASVAFEIGKDLGLLQFDFNDALVNVLDIIKTQDSSIQTTTQKVQEAVTRYIQMYQGFITHKRAGSKAGWTVEVRGEVRARYTVEKDQSFTLCLPIQQFQEWALERNIDVNHIKHWAMDSGIKIKSERIAPHTDPVRCFIIPTFKDEGIE